MAHFSGLSEEFTAGVGRLPVPGPVAEGGVQVDVVDPKGSCGKVNLPPGATFATLRQVLGQDAHFFVNGQRAEDGESVGAGPVLVDGRPRNRNVMQRLQ